MSFGNTAKDGSGTAYWLLVDTDGRLKLVGAVDHDAPAAGSPIRTAGVYRATPPAVADGDLADLLLDAAGRLHVADIAKIAGVAPQMDSTDHQAVSVYGKSSVAGDTPLLMDAAGAAIVTPKIADVWLAYYGQLPDGAAFNGGVMGYDQAMVFNGATWDRARTPSKFVPVALGAGTAEATLWTPASGKKFRMMGFCLTVGGAATLTFKDNTGGTTIFAARGATDQPIQPSGMGNGILSAAANNVLTVTRSASVTLDGTVWGTEE